MFAYLKAIGQEIRSLPSVVSDSAKEIRSIRSLTGASMLAALNVIIHQVFTVIVSLTQTISFAFITVGISGMLFGPVLTGTIGVATDLIKYIVKPNGGFFPGFTFNEFLMGFLYGIFLYKKKITLPRVFACRLTVTLVINLCLTPLWLSLMYGKAFIVLVSARLVKNIIMLPIETGILYVILKKVESIRLKRFA